MIYIATKHIVILYVIGPLLWSGFAAGAAVKLVIPLPRMQCAVKRTGPTTSVRK